MLMFRAVMARPRMALQEVTFNYTGSVIEIAAPADVIEVEIAGGRGGNATSGTTSPGLGGLVETTLETARGTLMRLRVGNHGNGPTWNGGAAGGLAEGQPAGGAGGDASDIRIGGDTLDHRVVVAPGGGGQRGGPGGGDGSDGGDGGGLTGSPGDGAEDAGGRGGTQSSGGDGGPHGGSGTQGPGQSGALGVGGNAAGSGGFGPLGGGGGGGGGLYGGGGGNAFGGGGGGSAYADPEVTSDTTLTPGANDGAGYITLRWVGAPLAEN